MRKKKKTQSQRYAETMKAVGVTPPPPTSTTELILEDLITKKTVTTVSGQKYEKQSQTSTNINVQKTKYSFMKVFFF